jgi:UDP-N-acetylmuramate--alanine ligase
MQYFPTTFGVVHFIGIGGIGMSGIAEILHNLGYVVQGSDQQDNANVARLRKIGIKVMVGHSPSNIEGAQVIVISSAVKQNNPELAAAQTQKIPIILRAEMLGELMRFKWSVAIAGSHGKTTTTSLVATLLEQAGFDPTVINGGVINSYGTNARLGTGRWMVVESDESDGSFTKLPATIGVVTNIDPEHLEHYGSFEELKKAFIIFLKNLPFYGYGVVCIDHPIVREICQNITDRKLITYGKHKDADVGLQKLSYENGSSHFSVTLKSKDNKDPQIFENLTLPMLGEHNVMNSLAAIAVAHELGIPENTIREGLLRFSGVKRRFTLTGVSSERSIIDDYAHHPVEIEAVLKTAKTAATKGKVVVVFQPHRYTRFSSLIEEFGQCFDAADSIIVSDIYSAGETPIPGINHDSVISTIQKYQDKPIFKLEKPEDLSSLVASITHEGDYVVCVGAGTITNWAYALPAELNAIWSLDKKAVRS